MRLPMWSSRSQLAVDLGTANTVVFRRGEGVVLFEPSVVAIDERTGDVHAVGSEARRMIGRTPSYISATRPLRDGVIADFAVTEQMLRHFIRKAAAGNVRSHADVMVCVPSGITQVERNAVTRAALAAGATHAFLIEEPMAAANGAGLPVGQPVGSLVDDVGGGTTEDAGPRRAVGRPDRPRPDARRRRSAPAATRRAAAGGDRPAGDDRRHAAHHGRARGGAGARGARRAQVAAAAPTRLTTVAVGLDTSPTPS